MKRDIKQNSAKGFLFLALLCVVMGSCKKSDWYDMKSNPNLVIPTTLKDFQALLDNNLFLWNFPNLDEVGADGNYFADANQVYMSTNERNAYSWTKDQPYNLVRDWANSSDGCYVRIFNANIILDGLKKLTPGTGDYNNVKGEALFHRGRNFYELSQVFAPPYLPSTATSELGIPLRLESDVNIPSKRSTLQETYDQILADLKEAEGLLPNSALYITRPSKNATDALLARIYLSMEDYPNALLYADKSLKLSSALINFNTISPTASPLLPVYTANPEMLIHSSIGGMNTAMFVDRDFYNSYAANDLRKTIYYTDNVTSVIMRATYFYTSSWDGLANDEMYLIRAETYARTDKPTEAMADLNTLLKNRYVNTVANPYVNRTAASADDALVQILTERRKELNRRGLRWSDLRRLNHDDRFKTTITHVLGGKTYTLEPNSYKYTFPIPDDIILASGIQQNKGW